MPELYARSLLEVTKEAATAVRHLGTYVLDKVDESLCRLNDLGDE